jgi:hypothetical protein
MAYIILDAGGWQNVVDFETGENLDSWDDLLVDDMLRFTPRFPFPGDVNAGSIEWTGNVGKALCDYFQPDFILLAYATPAFIKSSKRLSEEAEAEINRRLFDSVEGFLQHTGYTPVIIGTGGMSEIKDVLIPANLRGRISHGNGRFSYTGIFRATGEELEQIRKIPHMRLFTKDDIRRDFPDVTEEYLADMPDGLMLRESGYAFSRARARGMYQYKSSNVEDTLPIHTSLPMPSHITDVNRAIHKALDGGEKVALIVLEGTGTDDFLIHHGKLSAKDKWMVYTDSFSQYMLLLSGQPFYRFGLPLVRDIRSSKERSKRYPYSQITDKDLPKNVIGRRKDIKTAAVGSRSMYTHAISQADICIECQARRRIASGILVLINDPK